MSSRRNRTINMPAPYLKRIWLDPARFRLCFLVGLLVLGLDLALR